MSALRVILFAWWAGIVGGGHRFLCVKVVSIVDVTFGRMVVRANACVENKAWGCGRCHVESVGVRCICVCGSTRIV